MSDRIVYALHRVSTAGHKVMIAGHAVDDEDWILLAIGETPDAVKPKAFELRYRDGDEPLEWIEDDGGWFADDLGPTCFFRIEEHEVLK